MAPKAEASEPPWIPIVEKPITKATTVAGPSVTRSEKMNWRTNSWRQESPGLTSSPREPQRERRHPAGVQQPQPRRHVGPPRGLAHGGERARGAAVRGPLDPRSLHP